jgi:hypothetical protein
VVGDSVTWTRQKRSRERAGLLLLLFVASATPRPRPSDDALSRGHQRRHKPLFVATARQSGR